MEVLVRVVRAGAVLPGHAHDGDVGCDLVAAEGCTLRANGGRAMVPTGLCVAIPEGHGGFVLPRSGLAATHGVTCVNSPGLIDPGYRGEVKVALVNLDAERDYVVHAGDRIAQLVVLRVTPTEFSLVDALPESRRGEGGFGSSGR